MSDLVAEAIAPKDNIQSSAEVVVPPEHNEVKNTFTITPKDILEAEYTHVIQGTMSQLEDGKKPTYDHAAAFFNFMMKPRIEHRVSTQDLLEAHGQEVTDEERETATKYGEIHLPVVDTSAQEITLTQDISDQIEDWSQNIKPQGKGEVFPGGFRLEHDDDIDTDLLNLYSEVYKRLEDVDKAKLLHEMAPAIMSSLWEINEIKFLMEHILPSDFKNLTSEKKLEIVKPLFDELWSYDFESDEFKRIDYPDHPVFGTEIGSKIQEILLGDTFLDISADINNDITPWILYLMDKTDFEKSIQLLGKSIIPEQFPILLNSIRTLLKNNDISLLQRENLIKTGKILTGHEPDDAIDFYTSLDELYHSISFENYKPNQTATEKEADLIESILSAAEGKIKVLDLGCGTGRHLTELGKRQKNKSDEEKVEYIGLETNPRHVQVARENVGNEAQVLEGNWYEMPFEANSLDVIYCVGRNLPHVETKENFEKVMVEVHRVLKPGGVILFDMPNPEKGAYVQAQERVQKALKRIGVYPELLKNWSETYFSYIVDGPGEGKVYNRYAPSSEEVTEIVEDTITYVYDKNYGLNHMYSTEVGRQPIDDGEGSENIYYLAQKRDTKIKDPEVKELLHEHHLKVESFNKNIQEINDLKAKQNELLGIHGKIFMEDYISKLQEGRKNPEYMELSDRIAQLEAQHHSYWVTIHNSDDLHKKINNYFREQVVALSKKARGKIAA